MQDVDPVNSHYKYIFPNCKYYCQDFTASYGNYMKKGLSFIHFNARSLSSNFKFISNFLTELNTKFDLITISETWSNTQTVDDYDLKGYDVYHKVRNNRKDGGVACYVNELLLIIYLNALLLNLWLVVIKMLLLVVCTELQAQIQMIFLRFCTIYSQNYLYLRHFLYVEILTWISWNTTPTMQLNTFWIPCIHLAYIH